MDRCEVPILAEQAGLVVGVDVHSRPDLVRGKQTQLALTLPTQRAAVT